MIKGSEKLTFKRCLAELLESTIENLDNFINQIEMQLQEQSDNELYSCKRILDKDVINSLNEIIKILKASDT